MIIITHDGKTLTIAQWSAVTGLCQQTIRTRLAGGLPPAECLDTHRKTWGNAVVSRRRRRAAYRWRTQAIRDAALGEERRIAAYGNQQQPREMWDVPLRFDAWGLAALDIAIEEGGLTLDDIGKLMGVSRERVRQIEEVAARKIRRASRGRGVLDMLRDLDALRSARCDDEKGEAA